MRIQSKITAQCLNVDFLLNDYSDNYKFSSTFLELHAFRHDLVCAMHTSWIHLSPNLCLIIIPFFYFSTLRISFWIIFGNEICTIIHPHDRIVSENFKMPLTIMALQADKTAIEKL